MDKIKKNNLVFIIDEDMIKINIGAIFCHESKVKEMFHDNDEITDGNQRWKGGSPNFSIILIVMRIINMGKGNILLLEIKFIDLNKKILDPKAWTKKYFIALSYSNIRDEIKIIGVNDNIFNSNPIQIKNQFDADKEIQVLKIKRKENKNVWGSIERNIKCKRNLTFWVKIRSLFLLLHDLLKEVNS